MHEGEQMQALTSSRGDRGSLEIHVERLQGMTVFELRGDLDFHTAERLHAELDDAIDRGASRILLDLSPLRFCDSSGLQVVVSAYHRLMMGGGRLALVCNDPRVRRIFRVTRLDRVLGVCDERDEALERLDFAAV